MSDNMGADALIHDSQEIWKPIEGYDGWYDVSNMGRVRSWKNNGLGRRDKAKILKPAPTNGYMGIFLRRRGETVRQYIHHLVAEHFIGERPEAMQVNHKNGIKSDNRVQNLEYVTQSENLRHARDELDGIGRQVLTRQDAKDVIQHLTNGVLPQSRIAAMFNVTQVAISRIWQAILWSDLPRSYPVGEFAYWEWRKMQRGGDA